MDTSFDISAAVVRKERSSANAGLVRVGLESPLRVEPALGVLWLDVAVPVVGMERAMAKNS